MRMKKEGFDSNSAWEIFSSTGNVGMYLLYKALKDDQDNEERNRK